LSATSLSQRISRYVRRRLGYWLWGRPYPRLLSTAREFADHDIGEGTYGYLNLRTWPDTLHFTLRIGKHCTLGRGTTIMLGGEHRIDWITTHGFQEIESARPQAQPHSGDVAIGNDVWFGEDAIVLSGVSIGDGAVIGARTVVRRDVPPYSIVAGNPGRVVGFRFEKETIQALLDIAWWNWPYEKIRRALPMMYSNDVQAFIREYGKQPQ